MAIILLLVGNALILASWLKKVPPRIGWTGFFIALAGFIMQFMHNLAVIEYSKQQNKEPAVYRHDF